MTDKNCALILRPDFDVACAYGRYWYGLVIDDLLYLGLTVVDISGKDVTKQNVDRAISNYDPIYVTGIGHGGPDVFTGHNYEDIFTTCDCSNLKNRDIYLLSCQTAQRLGLDMIEKGALSYEGYWISYTFVIEYGIIDIEVDRYDKAFCDTSNLISYLYARNASKQDTFNIVRKVVKEWIKFWETKEDGAIIIQYLNKDYMYSNDGKQYFLYPDEDRKRDEKVTHNPTTLIVRDSKIESHVADKFQIIVICPQWCSLEGKVVQLLDNENNILSEQILVYDEGINKTDFFTVTPTGIDKQIWKANLIGDDEHPTTESLPITVLVQERAIIKGTVTNIDTGEPIEGVTITTDNIKITTDSLGYYSLEVFAPQEYMIRAEKAFYVPKEVRKNITEPREYTIDFQLKEYASITFTVDSSPVQGITIKYKREDRITPIISKEYQGMIIVIEVPEEILIEEIKYTWYKWEDGRTKRNIIVPIETSDIHKIAYYESEKIHPIECPYILTCNQQIWNNDFSNYCLGVYPWDKEKCLEDKLLDSDNPRNPKEWKEF